MNKTQQVANAIRARAAAWENWHEQEFGSDPFCGSKAAGAPDMVEYGKQDANDMRYIASLVEQGKVRGAVTAAAVLATVIRDELNEAGFFEYAKLYLAAEAYFDI